MSVCNLFPLHYHFLTIGLQKPLGLLSILDEESTFPNGTDLTFAEKLKQHLSTNICFKGDRGRSFSIGHFAGEVAINNFISSNFASLSCSSGSK